MLQFCKEYAILVADDVIVLPRVPTLLLLRREQVLTLDMLNCVLVVLGKREACFASSD